MNSNTDKECAGHNLTLISRKELKITGVRQILNFDDATVSFITSSGELEIDGDSLNIDVLDLNSGVATVTGNITGMNYVGDQQTKKRKLRSWL